MLSSFVHIAQRIGMDKSIAYSSGGNIIGGVTSVLVLLFIGTFLSECEQGFYFTFNSIIAIQVFFDLGLTGIMTQYVAHEQAHLEWADNKVVLLGDKKYLSRLASLLSFSVKWFGIISFVFLFAIIVVGFVFFQHYEYDVDIEWKTPWCLLCLGTAINMFLAPIMAYIMGLGKVDDVMRIRFYKLIIIPLITCVGLWLGAKLYVLGIASLATAIYNLLQVTNTQLGRILKGIWKTQISERVSYMKEVFPYQWKIALSWISGYLIFQLFNPVLFATDGPAVAGQMGMTLQILNAIIGLAMAWVNTKVPLFSRLIEMKQYRELDMIFNRTLKQVSAVSLSLLLVMLAGVVLLHLTDIRIGGVALYSRVLKEDALLLMMGAMLANMIVSSLATYLRCHKQEPMLIQSVTMGVLTMASTFLLGHAFGLYGITTGYFILCSLVSLPWTCFLFMKYKTIWHK